MNNLKLNDFVFYHFKDDKNYNSELLKKGVKCIEIPTENHNFQYVFTSFDVLKRYLPELLKLNNNFIIGLNNFKTDLFDGFKTSEEIFECIKDDWKNLSKTCYWNYSCLVKIDHYLFLIEDTIETHFYYPYENNNEGIFKLLIMPNSQKHFVHFNELTQDEKKFLTPKFEVFNQIENYLLTNFRNCPCFSIRDLK